MFPVDVLTVLAPGHTIGASVLEALKRQGHVSITHHLVEGPRRAGEDRVTAIARARNRARQRGTAHWVMFLDRDVRLPQEGIEQLVLALIFNPAYAALGINYQQPGAGPGAVHVAMGAVLFARPVLERIQFRAEPGLCECAVCCRDIRRMGYGIDYLPGLSADHLRSPAPGHGCGTHGGPSASRRPGRVLLEAGEHRVPGQL